MFAILQDLSADENNEAEESFEIDDDSLSQSSDETFSYANEINELLSVVRKFIRLARKSNILASYFRQNKQPG